MHVKETIIVNVAKVTARITLEYRRYGRSFYIARIIGIHGKELTIYRMVADDRFGDLYPPKKQDIAWAPTDFAETLHKAVAERLGYLIKA